MKWTKIQVAARTPVDAELLITGSVCGAFRVFVDADNRQICLKTPGVGSRFMRMADAGPAGAVNVVDVLDDVEEAASELFQDFEDCGLAWVWELNEDCNACKCLNCLN